MVQFRSMEQTTFRTTPQGWADLYAWKLDRASRMPLSRQIYTQVRSAVQSGALRTGNALTILARDGVATRRGAGVCGFGL